MSQAHPPMSTSPTVEADMTHRQVLEALSGLLLGMFVAILSSTVVSNALPRIITELHGTQSAYTWVVTSTLLATTATTPIWGKLADLTSKKLLVQLALVIFIKEVPLRQQSGNQQSAALGRDDEPATGNGTAVLETPVRR